MISTGIVRHIDSLGRVVLPKELRRTFGITADTPLEILTEGGCHSAAQIPAGRRLRPLRRGGAGFRPAPRKICMSGLPQGADRQIKRTRGLIQGAAGFV